MGFSQSFLFVRLGTEYMLDFFFLHLQVTSIIKCLFFDSVMQDIVETLLLLNSTLFACVRSLKEGGSLIQCRLFPCLLLKNIVHKWV